MALVAASLAVMVAAKVVEAAAVGNSTGRNGQHQCGQASGDPGLKQHNMCRNVLFRAPIPKTVYMTQHEAYCHCRPARRAHLSNGSKRTRRAGRCQGPVRARLLVRRGPGVPQDYAEAVRWYTKSAEQGDGMAQIMLGRMYEMGQGVPQDYVQAHIWYNQAYMSGSRKNRDISVKNRDNVAKRMTPAQIAEAQRLARE